MKQNKVIIIRINEQVKNNYEKLLDKNGMNLSKRIKMFINNDIKKLKENDNN